MADCDFSTLKYTVSFEPCPCVERTLAEQIEDAEQEVCDLRDESLDIDEESRENARQRAAANKKLADLKAKRDAEVAAKAKAQTYGEKVAETMVAAGVCGNIDFRNSAGKVQHIVSGAARGHTENGIRSLFAAALDKAHADGRAEQREKDAVFCESRRECYASCNPACDPMRHGIKVAHDYAATRIRESK